MKISLLFGSFQKTNLRSRAKNVKKMIAHEYDIIWKKKCYLHRYNPLILSISIYIKGYTSFYCPFPYKCHRQSIYKVFNCHKSIPTIMLHWQTNNVNQIITQNIISMGFFRHFKRIIFTIGMVLFLSDRWVSKTAAMHGVLMLIYFSNEGNCTFTA